MRKFLKLLNDINEELVGDPDNIINEFYMNETEEIFEYFNNYIDYELQLNVLLLINDKYGSDVMRNIIEFI